MITDEIRSELFKLQDPGYRDLQVKIIPNVDKESIIGVRTPALRQLAKEFAKRVFPSSATQLLDKQILVFPLYLFHLLNQ